MLTTMAHADPHRGRAPSPMLAPRAFGATRSGSALQLTRGQVTKRRREAHLGDLRSIRGHVMYARDQRIATRKARGTAKRASGARPAGKATPRERFFTHTEGHYVRTLSRRNLSSRVFQTPRTMTHVLTGRLDMCRNCQQHLIAELRRKYPGHRHTVHYTFNDLTGARTLWRPGEKTKRSTYPGGAIIRYNAA